MDENWTPPFCGVTHMAEIPKGCGVRQITVIEMSPTVAYGYALGLQGFDTVAAWDGSNVDEVKLQAESFAIRMGGK